VSFVRRCVAAHQLCEAEVEHLHSTILSDHHVGGLEVSVDDAACVGGGQGVGDRDGDA
jgi:hypothetical protein